MCRTPSAHPPEISCTRSDNTCPRPSRLFIAALLLPSSFPRLLTFLLSLLPVDWPRGERGKAFRLAVGNLVLLRHDRPTQAWHWMGRVLPTSDRALFARANERDVAQAGRSGWHACLTAC